MKIASEKIYDPIASRERTPGLIGGTVQIQNGKVFNLKLNQLVGPLAAFLLLVAPSGCSVKKFAINQVGNALAGGGTVFASDDDPEFVKAAVPFSLKLMESLLAGSPRHQGLLLAASSGFTQYGYAFVQQEADELEEKDFAAAKLLRLRACRLYLRARDYGLRGLEAAHGGFEKQLRTNPRNAVNRARTKDVPLLYWTAASWGAAMALSKDNPDLIADQIIVEALIDRALELNESFDRGAIHAFLVTYEMARAGGEGDPAARSRRHFERSMELCAGRQAGPLVSLAESVALPRQDKKEFELLLQRALAINADQTPEYRLVNLVMQRRARMLLSRSKELIEEPETKPLPKEFP